MLTVIPVVSDFTHTAVVLHIIRSCIIINGINILTADILEFIFLWLLDLYYIIFNVKGIRKNDDNKGKGILICRRPS